MKHVSRPTNAIGNTDIIAALRNARRNVAIAKLSQFESECANLGGILSQSPHYRRQIVDCLYEIATANSLLSTHGGPLIEGLISGGLEGAAE